MEKDEKRKQQIMDGQIDKHLLEQIFIHFKNKDDFANKQ